MDGFQASLEINSPRSAIGISPAPIVESVRGVAGLLDLSQDDPFSNRVDGASGNKNTLSHCRFETGDSAVDVVIGQRRVE